MERKLPKAKTRSKKRVGRGYGSGKGGHTVGRGQKGQKSRTKVGILFEGMKVRKSLLKRTPQLRGKTKFSGKPKPVIIDLDSISKLKAGSKVTVENLVKEGLVHKRAKELGVKILGQGKITKKLNIEVLVSESARKKIEKAGGKILENA